MPDSHPASAATIDPGDDEITALRQALLAQKDEYLRLAADFDNFRKRTRRDTEQQAAADKEAFILELLPILDNLERALASEHSLAHEPLPRGVALTLQQATRLLQRHGIEAAETTGQAFDPHRHEALSLGYDPRLPDQSVLQTVQRGYVRGGKLFRPAQVIVNELSRPTGPGHAH